MEDLIKDHIGQQIFEQLDVKSLINCKQVNKSWKALINNKKIICFKIIKLNSNAPATSIRKILQKLDMESAIKIVNDVCKIYKWFPASNMEINPRRFACMYFFKYKYRVLHIYWPTQCPLDN